VGACGPASGVRAWPQGQGRLAAALALPWLINTKKVGRQFITEITDDAWSGGGTSRRSLRKHLLHLAVGNKESAACWTEFFRHLLSRGMRLPTITSDGAPGLVKAITACFPASLRSAAGSTSH
jgi:Transposase, Mutator family